MRQFYKYTTICHATVHIFCFLLCYRCMTFILKNLNQFEEIELHSFTIQLFHWSQFRDALFVHLSISTGLPATIHFSSANFFSLQTFLKSQSLSPKRSLSYVLFIFDFHESNEHAPIIPAVRALFRGLSVFQTRTCRSIPKLTWVR